MSNIIATTIYTADFRQVSITFFNNADPEFVVVGEVSDDEIMALHAAEGGNVSGWTCQIN